jgi:GAF domain-containing protein
MAALARDLHAQRDSDPDHAHRAATEQAVAVIDGATAAALTIVRRTRGRQRIETHGPTDDDAATAGRLQDELMEGACVRAVSEAPTVHVADFRHDDRFPVWGPRVAAETALRSALSVRLFTHSDTLGALSVYTDDTSGFTPSAIGDAEALAAHVAIAIADAERITHLLTALDSRTVIGQATGIVMERYGVPASVAFSLMARIAATEEIKVHQLAVELTERSRTLDDGRRGAGA